MNDLEKSKRRGRPKVNPVKWEIKKHSPALYKLSKTVGYSIRSSNKFIAEVLSVYPMSPAVADPKGPAVDLHQRDRTTPPLGSRSASESSSKG